MNGLADTSLFIARETSRTVDTDALPDELGVSVITVGELYAGVLAARDTATRHRRLQTLTDVQELEAWPVDGGVAEAWAALRVRLRESGQRMPVNDSWIAATAIRLGVPVVTQDDDYDVLDLDVVRV